MKGAFCHIDGLPCHDTTDRREEMGLVDDEQVKPLVA
jgi:hypothetical protein